MTIKRAPRTKCTWPRRPLSGLFAPSKYVAAVAPRATITSGRTTSICRNKNWVQVCASSGSGTRFPGGLHFWSHNQDAPSRAALDLDRWQMLTATYDGEKVRLYKDGAKVAERAVVLADDEGIINIAPIDPWEHERQFKGDIRALTIWNSALSEEALSGLLKNSPK